MMERLPELLRIARVAGLLDVSRKRVYHLMAQGRLERVELGPRSVRVTRDSLDAYLDAVRARGRYVRGETELKPKFPYYGPAKTRATVGKSK